jgi:cell division protein FtsI/penicillin-binding protein 2
MKWPPSDCTEGHSGHLVGVGLNGRVTNSSRFRRPRSRIAVVGVLLLALCAGIGGAFWYKKRANNDVTQARALAQSFVAALSAGTLAELPFADKAPDFAEQNKLLQNAATQLGRPTVTLSSFRQSGKTATANAVITREPTLGQKWAYTLPIALVKQSSWKVAADQRLIHPELPPGEKPETQVIAGERAGILDAKGAPLVEPRPVVVIGVEPRRISGPVSALTNKLAPLLDLSAGQLETRIKVAKPTEFVEIITLREADFQAKATALKQLTGLIFRDQKLPLAPTREFARALLGTVGPVTAEIVQNSKGQYQAGDNAGLSGLQRQYDKQLAGTKGISIKYKDKVLFSATSKPGKALPTTLEGSVQLAADSALAGVSAPAAIVGIRISTGAIAAVANSPATGLNRALLGRYAPGSTFKMISTLALLQKGLTTNETVPCPKEANVSGRKFTNYQDEEFGNIPFSRDFALSCNTAFVRLSTKLGKDDLRSTATLLGVGQKWSLGTEAFTGTVPQTASAVDLAATTFGQGRSEFSPVALAVATATVARGSYRAPTLINPASVSAAEKPLPTAVKEVQKLMRLVVTDGTGSSVAEVPGEPVSAKTGTAEFGGDSPPKTRAWLIGWQGDLAFAVLVEEGKSGGTVAGPIAAKFLAKATP